jgi:hypothetical protein
VPKVIVHRSIFAILLSCAGLPVCGGAFAACTGGPSVKGNFGVLIHGPLYAGSGGTESYAGILKSNGKCGLTGSLTGGISGVAATTTAVTGTYSVPTTGQGAMSLVFAGSTTPITFSFGVVNKGKELTGVETDDTAAATIDVSAIPKLTFTNASIAGAFVQTCFGAGRVGSTGPDSPGAEVDYETYDGAGNLSGTATNPNGASFPYSGTYAVNGDGTYIKQLNAPYNYSTFTGAIVGSGSELHSVNTVNPATGVFGAYEVCVEKK